MAQPYSVPAASTKTLTQYTAAGTYTWSAPAGTSVSNPVYPRVVIVGAGGGGGAQDAATSGAGGSAGQMIVLPAVKVTGDISITVGAGGAGSATGGATAGAGGSTTFGTVTAAGGAGAVGSSGGAATTGMPTNSKGASGSDGARFILFETPTAGIATSGNGKTWTNQGVYPSSLSSVQSGLTANGRTIINFYSGSSGLYVNKYTTDGLTWTNITWPDNNYKSVRFFNSGTTVLAALTYPNGGQPTTNYAYSTNGGTSFAFGTLPSSKSWSVTFTNGTTHMFAADGSTTSYTSTTLGGATGTWTARTFPSGTFIGAAFGNSIYVITEYSSGTIYTSTDLITWTSRGSVGSNVRSVVYAGNKFFSRSETTNATSYSYSTDGITWNTGNLPAGSASDQSWLFNYVGTTYYCINKIGIHTSADGITWTLQTAASGISATWSTNGPDNYSQTFNIPYQSLGTVSGAVPTAPTTYVGDLPPMGGGAGNATTTTGSGGSGGSYVAVTAAASTGATAATAGQAPGAGGGGGGAGSTSGANGADGLVQVYL
jgi:hypothetical protein